MGLTVVLTITILLIFAMAIMVIIGKKNMKKTFLYGGRSYEDKMLLHAEKQTKLLIDIKFYLRIFFYLTMLGLFLYIIAIIFTFGLSSLF